MSDLAEILNVLGRYTRAHDERDGQAMASLFTEDAVVDIVNALDAQLVPLGTLTGRAAIEGAVSQMMVPHSPGGWSQNVISAPIVEVKGDEAIVDAQFMVFDIAGLAMPAGGWPAGTFGAQGTIRPMEVGRYHPVLRRTPQGWQIASMKILHRLPMAFG